MWITKGKVSLWLTGMADWCRSMPLLQSCNKEWGDPPCEPQKVDYICKVLTGDASVTVTKKWAWHRYKVDDHLATSLPSKGSQPTEYCIFFLMTWLYWMSHCELIVLDSNISTDEHSMSVIFIPLRLDAVWGLQTNIIPNTGSVLLPKNQNQNTFIAVSCNWELTINRWQR